MNSSNKLPFKKRNSAFDSTPSKDEAIASSAQNEPVKEESKSPFSSTKSKSIFAEEEITDVKPAFEEKKEEKVVVVEEKKVEKPQPVQQTVAKQPVKKVNLKEEDDPNREKYTATMEKSLRKRVKIAAIEMGLQVSSFIEEACKEKLEREGY